MKKHKILCATLFVFAVTVGGYFYLYSYFPGFFQTQFSDYVEKYDISGPGDMNEKHWKVLLPNVPKELRPKLAAQMETLAQEAGNEEWLIMLFNASKFWFKEYPSVYDPKNKSEYWKQATEEFCLYLEDRTNLFRKKKETHDSMEDGQRDFFVHQLTEEQKEKLLRSEPLYINPKLGLFFDRYIVSMSSWSIPENPMQAFMFKKRNEELAPFRIEVGTSPELRNMDLRVEDILRWDGSTSLQPVARIVAANSNDLTWRWRPPGSYDIQDKDRIVFTDHYDYAFDDEVYSGHFTGEFGSDDESSGYNRRFQKDPHYYMGTPSAEKFPPPGNSKPTPLFLNAMKFNQTHQSYVNLIEGKKDLLFATRMPSPDETALAKKLGVELEFHPFAQDGFVFLANRHNSVRDLTVEQVRDIFSGKTTKWKDVDGFGTIKPLIRDANSGSEELMRSLVMKNVPVQSDFEHQLIASMYGIFDALEKDAQGIGYSIMYYDRFMVCSPYTRSLRINGVEPTPETVADGSYPLIYQCVAVVRKDSPERAKSVALWLCSEEGARVVHESGYVPVDAVK